MASLSTFVARAMYRNPIRPICVGVLIVLIIVSWRFFLTQPDSSVIRRFDLDTKTFRTSKSPADEERKRLVNIPSEQSEDDNEVEEQGEAEDIKSEAKKEEVLKIREKVKEENMKDLEADVANMDKAEQEMAPELGSKSPTQQKKAMTQFKPKSDYFRIGEYNILMTLVKAYHGSPLAVSTEKCIKSICKHSIIPITFHFIVDKKGTDVVKGIFMRTSGHCTNPDIVFHDADKLAERLKGIVQVLQRPFSYKKGAYYSDPIFFLSTALHKVFPENLTKIIMLDSDLRFRNDINLLFQHFKKFESSNIMGLATEQQPVYRHIFDTYRHNNPGTMVGEPPPNGITGFNSGVALLHLENMRRSKTYNQIISSEAAIDMAKKYNFKGHLGDQDFYSLLSVEHKDLFYILPCGWNRQLCSYWRDNGYAKVFDLYFNCSMPVHVYHGNCRTAIPED